MTDGNTGEAYRVDDVDIEASMDVSGGYNVGWIEAGEWLEYRINITEAADYQTQIRVASEEPGGMLAIELNGEVLGEVFSVPATGGWQSWITLTQAVGGLPQGEHTVRVQLLSGSFNLNWVALTADTGMTEPLATCTSFSAGVEQGRVAAAVGNEISGVSASAINADTLWVHNDSGDQARVMAISKTGSFRAEVFFPNVSANDFEDIAIDAQNRIYIADIGDNPSQRGEIALYRFAEPTLSGNETQYLQINAEVIRVQYPDGAHNAESFFIDPVSGDLLILTKTGADESGVYRLAVPSDLSGVYVLEKVQSVRFPGELTTAGDISRRGDLILVRTYGNLYAWAVGESQTFAEALSGTRVNVPVRSEQQGEAVSFAADGQSYYTISEGDSPAVYEYHCVE